MPRDGTLSTHILVPEPCLYPKPSQWSFEQAAALPLAGLTAWRALVTQAQLQKGDEYGYSASGAESLNGPAMGHQPGGLRLGNQFFARKD